MDLILQCLISVVMTSTSAYNQDFFGSTGLFNPYRSRPDIYPQNYRHYETRYLDETQIIRERSAERPNERQKMNERSIDVSSGVQRVQELEKKRLLTRVEETHPRAENGSSKIVNVKNRRPYPVIVNRRGESEEGSKLVFPGPTSSSHTKQFEPEIPEKCRNLGICEEINNYPHDIVNSIIAELGEKIKSRLSVDELEQPEVTQRFGPGEQNIELCKFNETVVMPQAAQTESGEWHVILNQKDVPLQGYRVEICSTTKRCSNIVNFVNGYTARCKQKYVHRTMAAVDVNNRKLIYDKTFRVPSCCSCVASHQDDSYDT